MLSTIAEIIRDLLIFVGVVAALLVAFIALADTNPLKRLLTALCYRLGATLAAGAAAIPLEAVPGIDLLYDVGVPLILVWYWFTFFRDARRMTSEPLPLARGRVTSGGASQRHRTALPIYRQPG